MAEKSELTKLCDEIARMIPSYELKDTATTQFKEFISKLHENKVNEQEIKYIIQAYNYFNQLMGVVVEDTPHEKENNETKILNESVTGSEPVNKSTTSQTDTTASASATTTATATTSEDTDDADMIEMLLNLAEYDTKE